MRKIFRYVAAKLGLRAGCGAPFKAANAIEQDLGDSELACAVVESCLELYNDMLQGTTPDKISADKPFLCLILDRPLTWTEKAFIKTYYFDARSTIPEQYLDKNRKTTYYFHSLHSLYFKRKS